MRHGGAGPRRLGIHHSRVLPTSGSNGHQGSRNRSPHRGIPRLAAGARAGPHPHHASQTATDTHADSDTSTETSAGAGADSDANRDTSSGTDPNGDTDVRTAQARPWYLLRGHADGPNDQDLAAELNDANTLGVGWIRWTSGGMTSSRTTPRRMTGAASTGSSTPPSRGACLLLPVIDYTPAWARPAEPRATIVGPPTRRSSRHSRRLPSAATRLKAFIPGKSGTSRTPRHSGRPRPDPGLRQAPRSHRGRNAELRPASVHRLGWA